MASRTTLRNLVLHQDRLRQEMKDLGANVGQSITAELAEPQLISLLAGNAPIAQPSLGQRLGTGRGASLCGVLRTSTHGWLA